MYARRVEPGIGYSAAVRRTQIYLDEAQQEALRAIARRRGVTVAAVIREILDAHLGLGPAAAAGRVRAADPMDGVVGMARGDGAAVAEHVEDYLYGEAPAARPRGKKGRRR